MQGLCGLTGVGHGEVDVMSGHRDTIHNRGGGLPIILENGKMDPVEIITSVAAGGSRDLMMTTHERFFH